MSPTPQRHSGVVVAFDAHVGLGDIKDQHGAVWPFHCVSVSDGSRSVEIGAHVKFTVRFHVRRDEAFDIEVVATS
jgi:hypothetical protein